MIDPKTEETFRELTGHAIHSRQDDMARVIAEAGEQVYGAVVALAVQAAAYVCIDTAERWPTDADLKSAARIASEGKTGLPVTADEIRAYLSGVVFGSDTGANGHAMMPLFALATLVTGFKPPQGKGWNDWLDVIEAAIEAADQVQISVLPALVYRFGRK